MFDAPKEFEAQRLSQRRETGREIVKRPEKEVKRTSNVDKNVKRAQRYRALKLGRKPESFAVYDTRGGAVTFLKTRTLDDSRDWIG